MPESAFDDMQGLDIMQDFEHIWLELGAREASDAGTETDRDSVWLECNGELLDAPSVKLIGVRKSPGGFETLLFMCPRCSEPHESLRLR
jgi:hypothetical protein